jgi:hypothetical protein
MVQELDSSHPKPGRMEETLEGGRGPPWAVVPLEREREMNKIFMMTFSGVDMGFQYSV